jgi:hypothetical protein
VECRCDGGGAIEGIASWVCREIWESALAKELRHRSLKLLDRGGRAIFPSVTAEVRNGTLQPCIKGKKNRPYTPSSSTNFWEKSFTTHLIPLRRHFVQLASPSRNSQRIL